MNLSAYDEPQPLRRLIEDILSPKELDSFRQLDEAYRAARRGDLPFEDLDSADGEWQPPQVDRRRAKETLARGELLLRGWLHGGSSQQPTLLPPGLLADGQLWVAENEVRANGQRYVSCMLVRSNAALATGSAEGPKPGSPGRPPTSTCKRHIKKPLLGSRLAKKGTQWRLNLQKNTGYWRRPCVPISSRAAPQSGRGLDVPQTDCEECHLICYGVTPMHALVRRCNRSSATNPLTRGNPKTVTLGKKMGRNWEEYSSHFCHMFPLSSLHAFPYSERSWQWAGSL